jgi:hypothetical protein
MLKSETIGKFAAALAQAQGKMKGAAKDSANPFFKSKYADLASVWDACRDALADASIAVVQLPKADGAKVTVTTMLAHSEGEWVSEDLTVTAKDDSPQAVGSAITYCRRYGLASLVGVAPEDDDGEAAQGRPVAPARPHPVKAPEKALAETVAKERIARSASIWKRAQADGFTEETFKDLVARALGVFKKSPEWTDEDLDKLEDALGSKEKVAF